MHEVSLVAALVEQVGVASREHGFERVLEIRVGVGALSGVDPDCIEFCFPEVTRASVLEGAKLVLERIPLEVACRLCAKICSPADPAAILCEHCGSNQVEIKQGREFKVIDLEVS